jgi:xanthine permease XanP
MPQLAAQLPGFARPIFSSGLTVATVMVVLLNALFHLGARRRQKIELAPEPESIIALCEFVEDFSALWGARREVVTRAVGAMTEFLESVIGNGLVRSDDVEVSAFFDAYRLDFTIRYRGQALEIPASRRRLPSIRSPRTF